MTTRPPKIEDIRSEIPTDDTDIGPDNDTTPKRKKTSFFKDDKPKTSTRRGYKLRLTQTIGGIGKTIAAFNRYDGYVIIDQTEPLAEALDAWAKDSPRVARTLDAMLTVSATASFMGVLVAVVVPILANHGLIPVHFAETVGAPPVPNPERFYRPNPEDVVIMEPLFPPGTVDLADEIIGEEW